MKLIVTGAAGFIGSYLVKKLSAEHDVLGIDDMSHASVVPEDIKCLDWDIRNPLDEVLGDWTPDAIFHLAAITSLPECQGNPAYAIGVNVGGSAQVLRYAALVGSRVLMTSTSAVYEQSKPLPFYEETPVHPDLVYSLTKRQMEDLGDAYRKNYNLHVSVLRLFNVYGNRLGPARKQEPYISYLLRSLRDNVDMTLYCDSERALRDYVYIEDVTDACLQWLNSRVYSATFNCCSGKGISAPEILRTCLKLFPDYTGKITYAEPQNLWAKYPELATGVKPLKLDRIQAETYKTSVGSTDYASKYLKWTAKYSLEEGLRHMLGR